MRGLGELVTKTLAASPSSRRETNSISKSDCRHPEKHEET